MGEDDSLRARYETSQGLMDQLRYAAETLSMEFDRWDEPHVSGPGLYFIVVADTDYGAYTDALGSNTWPVDRCRIVGDPLDAFIDAAREVAFSRDGAVVVAADGTIQEQMVRVRSDGAEGMVYPDWMGTRHLSAMEASTREEVLWAVTLSEENGRVTTYHDGNYRDYEREDLSGRWRPDG